MGNKAIPGGEVEFEDAWGLLIGEEGRGIPTIIEMATYTASAVALRQRGHPAPSHRAGALRIPANAKPSANRCTNNRSCVTSWPIFALESEARYAALRLAEAFEKGDADPLSKALKRLITPAAQVLGMQAGRSLPAKPWKCSAGTVMWKKSTLGRLFRKAPVNSAFGKVPSNVMCLDVLRAMGKESELVGHVLTELNALA